MSLWLNFASLPVGRQGYVQNDILVVFNWANLLKNQWHFQQFIRQLISLCMATERYGYVGEKTTGLCKLQYGHLSVLYATSVCRCFLDIDFDLILSYNRPSTAPAFGFVIKQILC